MSNRKNSAGQPAGNAAGSRPAVTSPELQPDLAALQDRIGYRFRDPDLLLTALTHSSWANEHRMPHDSCYERLEFLGDSILGLNAAELLYRWQPALPEGRMTRIRAELVCEESLHRVACRLKLGELMRLGRGAEISGDRARPSILADTVEAVIAAIWLDGGGEAAAAFIHAFVLNDAHEQIENLGLDRKTALQELLQRDGAVSIRYAVLKESGPDHDKRFTCAVFVNDRQIGEGEGRSKKEAEQAAAASALRGLSGRQSAGNVLP